MPTYNSIIPYVGNGVQTRWEVNFSGGFIDAAHVFVVRADIPVVALFEGAATVVIEPAVPTGEAFTLERRTPKDAPLVDYTSGADFSEQNLDTTNRQAVFLAAEAADKLDRLVEDLVGPIGPAGLTVYQIAVLNGFVGNEAAWLASLVGAPGPPGSGSSGLLTASALTMNTGKILGRSTASTGAIEELAIGAGLSLAGGVLTGNASGTRVKLAADQGSILATAVDITGLAFTPAANTTYEFEAVIIAKLSSGTSNFKIGLAWPTGLTTGHALLSHTTSLTLNHTSFATNDQYLVEVTNAATYLSPAFSLGADTYRMIRVVGIVDAGATPSGAFKLQFASNGSHTATIKAGSFIKYTAI